MAMQGLKISKRVFSQDAAGTAYASSTTATKLMTNGVIPANTLEVGDVIRVRLYAGYGVTGTPTLTFILVNGTTAMLSSGALTTSAAGKVLLEFEGVVTAVGTSGTILWRLASQSSDSGLNTVVGDTTADDVDTTADLDLNVTATWSAPSASNTITGYHFSGCLN